MNPVLLSVLGDGVRKVLDSLFPDAEARAAAELELRKLEQSGTFEQRAALQLQLAQATINNTEAASASWFRGGWRPGAGWVCVAALAMHYVVGPALQWGAAVTGHQLPPMPGIDGALLELLVALLGLGSLRSIERVKGRA